MATYTPQNSHILSVRKVIRDLLNTINGSSDYTLTNVIEGATNFKRANSITDYIVISSLSPATTISSYSSVFDPDQELMTTMTNYKQDVTVNLYGDNAFVNAQKITAGIRLQQGFDILKLYGININAIKSFNNVSFLEDKRDIPRYEIVFETLFINSVTINQERINIINTDIN